MQKQLVFHIGLHKTATTFFQDIAFPTLKDWNYLDRPFVQHNHAFNKLQFEDDSLYDPDLVKEVIEGIPGDQLLFSSEDLTGHPWVSAINRSQIARRIHEISPYIKIILFIRGQRDILYSHYNNFIKAYRGTKNVEKFVWKPQMDFSYEMYENDYKAPLSTLYYNTAWFCINVDNFKYFEMVSYYKHLFGDNLYVFPYEEFHQHPNSIFEKLEWIFDERIDQDVKNKASQQKVNSSLKNRDLHKKLIVNKVTAGTNNRYFNKLSEKAVDLAFLASHELKNSPEKVFINNLAKDYYTENNLKLIEYYPEIGIQNYPDNYDF